jgi:hypothetical protein
MHHASGEFAMWPCCCLGGPQGTECHIIFLLQGHIKLTSSGASVVVIHPTEPTAAFNAECHACVRRMLEHPPARFTCAVHCSAQSVAVEVTIDCTLLQCLPVLADVAQATRSRSRSRSRWSDLPMHALGACVSRRLSEGACMAAEGSLPASYSDAAVKLGSACNSWPATHKAGSAVDMGKLPPLAAAYASQDGIDVAWRRTEADCTAAQCATAAQRTAADKCAAAGKCTAADSLEYRCAPASCGMSSGLSTDGSAAGTATPVHPNSVPSGAAGATLEHKSGAALDHKSDSDDMQHDRHCNCDSCYMPHGGLAPRTPDQSPPCAVEGATPDFGSPPCLLEGTTPVFRSPPCSVEGATPVLGSPVEGATTTACGSTVSSHARDLVASSADSADTAPVGSLEIGSEQGAESKRASLCVAEEAQLVPFQPPCSVWGFVMLLMLLDGHGAAADVLDHMHDVHACALPAHALTVRFLLWTARSWLRIGRIACSIDSWRRDITRLFHQHCGLLAGIGPEDWFLCCRWQRSWAARRPRRISPHSFRTSLLRASCPRQTVPMMCKQRYMWLRCCLCLSRHLVCLHAACEARLHSSATQSQSTMHPVAQGETARDRANTSLLVTCCCSCCLLGQP